ncbi:DUF5134 domain-containing protein [Streptomyces sp. KR80]|uniref:DUF5134 domain-containing protein n=1 Tax=Streptomyces sp. KR80 TaxID=3457426 RepID=UPI003FD126FE
MHGPPLVGWLMVAVCGASGLYCLMRTRARNPEVRRHAGGEAIMGLGMAAMAVPVLAADPQAWMSSAFVVVFATAALRGLLLVRTGVHHLHHALGSVAMVHMALSGGAGGHHSAVQPADGIPLLTGLLLAYFAVYVLRTGVRMVPLGATADGGPAAPGTGWVERPEVATACRVSMGIGTFAMLLTV